MFQNLEKLNGVYILPLQFTLRHPCSSHLLCEVMHNPQFERLPSLAALPRLRILGIAGTLLSPELQSLPCKDLIARLRAQQPY